MKEKTIYMVTPPAAATGGIELCYQLVHQLTELGGSAKVLFFHDSLWRPKKGMLENPIHKHYKKYNVQYTFHIEDIENNVLIVPEIYTHLLAEYKNVKKCVWWMSVDNYLTRFNDRKDFFRRVLPFYKSQQKITELIAQEVIHFYQSHYAFEFLMENSVDEVKCFPLGDYINDKFLNIKYDLSETRSDNVLYNPVKGIEFTRQLIEKFPEFNWIPLQNMSPSEIAELLLKSKVYIDFGNHPGMDRFPREAAMLGCCVIVGKKGSANYFEDVSISEEFKFEVIESQIDRIGKAINECLHDFHNQALKQEEYRRIISAQREKFISDSKAILEL